MQCYAVTQTLSNWKYIRALSTVGIITEHFGLLLIPIASKKLPNVIRLQIRQELGKENWDVDTFIKCINNEISVRDHFQYLKNQDGDEKTYFTTSALTIASGSWKKRCVFCDKKHYNNYRDQNKCSSRCFKSLKGSHIAKSVGLKSKV